eukprot:8866507-Alexandrium_andersonii.AAC.1
MRAEDASSPAAQEAFGPLAPGAHPREGKLASHVPGRYVTYVEDRTRNYCTVGGGSPRSPRQRRQSLRAGIGP